MKISLVVTLLFSGLIYCQMPKVTSGKIEHFDNFKSSFVNARNIDVWLPDGYSEEEKYAVIYMHDGQMLFDNNITWNKQAWEVDETAGKLNAEGKTKKFIVVGIWNNGQKRHFEYFPQKAFRKLSAEEKEFVSNSLKLKGRINETFNPISDNYLKFIVAELKPFIDIHFSTLKDKDNTFIAGSSMGGLISLYAICEYPDVFGAAACLSTHWTGIFQLEDNPVPAAFFDYMRTYLPDPRTHRIYFDYGDQTLDQLYFSLQLTANDIMREKGFNNANWKTLLFPGKDHSEKSWAERLPVPLEFLMKE
jgi:enterochelin esterase-like enzyme